MGLLCGFVWTLGVRKETCLGEGLTKQLQHETTQRYIANMFLVNAVLTMLLLVLDHHQCDWIFENQACFWMHSLLQHMGKMMCIYRYSKPLLRHCLTLCFKHANCATALVCQSIIAQVWKPALSFVIWDMVWKQRTGLAYSFTRKQLYTATLVDAYNMSWMCNSIPQHNATHGIAICIDAHAYTSQLVECT